MENIVPLKRAREETNSNLEFEEQVLKKQNSNNNNNNNNYNNNNNNINNTEYNDIINLLEGDEDESSEDLSSLISSLQEELSSGSGLGSGSGQPDPDETDPGTSEEEGVRVMRHLLEASDDELGIPHSEGFDAADGRHVDGGDFVSLCGEGLWEFEDYEAANYYNQLLQSEIFL